MVPVWENLLKPMAKREMSLPPRMLMEALLVGALCTVVSSSQLVPFQVPFWIWAYCLGMRAAQSYLFTPWMS